MYMLKLVLHGIHFSAPGRKNTYIACVQCQSTMKGPSPKHASQRHGSPNKQARTAANRRPCTRASSGDQLHLREQTITRRKMSKKWRTGAIWKRQGRRNAFYSVERDSSPRMSKSSQETGSKCKGADGIKPGKKKAREEFIATDRVALRPLGPKISDSIHSIKNSVCDKILAMCPGLMYR